jgi:hypothetical protein
MSILSVAPNRDRLVTALSRVARVCRDSEACLRRAADLASLGSLREVLDRLACERARFAHELEIEAQVLGGLIPLGHSGVHASHGADATSSDDQRVGTCRDADLHGLAEYERALRNVLPVELERLLRGHHASIRDGLDRLSQLRRALA